MDTLYVETSVVSHATARSSADIQIAAIQQQARDWWAMERFKFQLVTSQLVVTEASAGDVTAVAERMRLLAGVPLIPITSEAEALAESILSESLMPPKAAADALHVAVAAVAGIKYLLTQNCRHIANAHVLPQVYKLLRSEGFGQLLICTPVEFLGGDDDKSNP
jgi:hypothetical protein